jgi:histidyl-tRNA synthetase
MNEQQPFRPKARLPRGFKDRDEAEIAAERRMLETIRRVYESYGFAELQTSSLEYADALGKFLPDQDRPNEGVFSFADDDGQWVSLRYDLTAPLARYVAENFQTLPKPFRRFQVGTVWRNEKPGPGRFREFTQFDADTVGSASPAADAELLMMMADTLEALGLKRGDYAIKLNSRKILDGVLNAAGVDLGKRGTVLRAIDKFDRLGQGAVRALLGDGRKDESGDFTKGAGLNAQQIEAVTALVSGSAALASMPAGIADDVLAIQAILKANGYADGRIVFDPGVVRGLDYYTGAVFEAQLTFPVTNESGETVVFGSVGGGGRYDDLVARFTGQSVPATGFSIGVSRLLAALKARAGAESFNTNPLIVVLALDKNEIASSFAMARELRSAGFRAEAYVGTKKFGDQLKYADKRGAAIAVIEGGDERARGEVVLKDLALGAELAKSIESRAAWTQGRPAQHAVKRSELAEKVRAMLAGRG